MLRSDFCPSNKSLKYFTNRVCNFLSPCVLPIINCSRLGNATDVTHFDLLLFRPIYYSVSTRKWKSIIIGNSTRIVDTTYWWCQSWNRLNNGAYVCFRIFDEANSGIKLECYVSDHTVNSSKNRPIPNISRNCSW